MKNKLTIFFSLFTFIEFGTLAQDQQDPYSPSKIIPPSPTAASLGVFGDIPVGYFTGTPAISIPLYEIAIGNTSLPITLSYNATGIRVAQDASWVGLGWSLSAGGLITRTVRGLDDFAWGGYYYCATLPPWDGNNDYLIPAANDYPAQKYASDYFVDILSKQKDGDPDIFSYHFGNYSGKFVFTKQQDGGKILCASKNNLDIKYNLNTKEWIIRTPDGYEYFFKTNESSKDYYSSTDLTPSQLHGLWSFEESTDNEIISSWYLDLIKSPTGEKINFTYHFGNSLSIANKSQKRYDRVGSTTTFSCCATNQGVYNYYITSRQAISDVNLEKIEFNNGRIEFETTDRDDIERRPFYNSIPTAYFPDKPQKLSSIKIFNLNKLIKEYAFSHSYFNNNKTDYSDKRLKLDAITEKNDYETKNPYSFTYYDPENLPNKYSVEIDDWGFATKPYFHPMNASLLPKVIDNTPRPDDNIPTGTKYFDGVTRIPDGSGEYMKKGIITSITYPTKGKTEFNFEPHDYAFGAYDKRSVWKEVRSNSDLDEYHLIETISLSQTTDVLFTPVNFPLTGDQEYTEFFGYLKNATGDIILSFNLGNGKRVKTLDPGTYTLEVDQLNGYYAAIFADYDEPFYVKNKICGGLRIQSITNYDFNNKVLNKKRFVYTKDGTIDGWSSGMLLVKPLNYFFQEVQIMDGAASAWAEYLVRSSSTNIPNGFCTPPNPLGYSDIYVLEGENAEGGKTHYSYYINDLKDDYEYSDYVIPELPEMFDSRNGQLEKTKVFDNSNRLLKTTTYSYELKEKDILKGVKIFKPRPENHLYFRYADKEVKYYDNISEWWVKSSETTENYFNGKVLTTVKNYEYTNPVHRQITRESIVNSDQSVLSTSYKYPSDFASLADVYNSMMAKHIIAPVIEQVQYKDNTFLQSITTSYTKWINDIIAPEKVDSKKGSSTQETRLHFYNYDKFGNVLSVGKEKNVKENYIWSYNHSYPVAKIVNADYSVIESVLGGDNILAFSIKPMPTASEINSFLAPLFSDSRLKDAMISTYTYDPLIGITTETDPNKIITTYQYDQFGRLQAIIDNHGNIRQSFKYHYKQ